MISSGLGYSALLVCALLLAGRSYRVAEQQTLSSMMVISLAAAFIAAASLMTLARPAATGDILVFQRILDNLAYYAGIPLLASAVVDLAWNKQWSRAAWGRWLLVLFALFELCRRSQVGEEYSQGMAIITALALCIASLKLYGAIQRLSGVLSAATLASALLIFSATSLTPEHRDSGLYALNLALALLLLLPLADTKPTPKAND